MRRILLVLAVALVMAAMMVVTATPAFAKNSFQTDPDFDKPPGPPISSGAGTTVFHCNSPVIEGERGAIVINKNARHDNCV